MSRPVIRYIYVYLPNDPRKTVTFIPRYSLRRRVARWLGSPAVAVLAIVLALLGMWLWLAADCDLTRAATACLSASGLLAIAYVFSTDLRETK